jgi:PAS domain S-box-containing protein
MEADGRTGDGRVLSLSVSARSLLDRSGEARGTVLVLRDVADLAKAEAARRLSDERYRSFVQNFPGIAFRGDLDLSLEFVHGAVESITGYPAGQFLSQPNLWRELTHPDDRARVQASTDRLRTEPGCTMTREYRIVRQDGTTRWLRVSLSNVCDAAGTPVLVQGSAYDVTSERKAMAELAELSQLRESIIDNANVWMMVADTKMNVLVWNKAAERISGYTRDEVVGSRAVWSRLYPDPDYREQLKQFGRPQVERGREVAGLETPIVCKNGEKRFVSLTWRPIVSPSGTISAIVILGQDVTEEKRALAYLRESEEKYRTLVERAIDGIVIVQDGVVKYANPTLVNISGRSLTELGSSPFSAFLAPSEIPKVAERYRRRMAGESVPSSYETTFLRSDGVAVPVELNAGLTTYEGRPADLVLVRDITDRRRALEQEARHVENMSLLSRAALELVEMSPDEDVYRFVGERIKDASGAMLAFVNSYDRTARTITVRAALGLGPMTEAVIRALGRHPVGMVMPVSAEPYRELLSGQLVEVTGGLHALSLGTIPQPVCDMIESLLGMGQAFSIGFAWEGELYGNTTFVLRRGQVMRGPEVVQALVRQCAIALRRRQVEDTLEQSERSFRALADGTRDGILVADEAGRWAYVNASAAAALGWPRDELVGRNVSDVLKPEDVATVRERFARWIAGEAIPPSYSLRLVKKDGSEIRARLWAVRTVWNGLPVVMATVRFGTSVEPNRERGA